ncbi:MAG: ribosomal protein S6--L-glutamate ligase, partial [Saprospiraceae bacterium]
SEMLAMLPPGPVIIKLLKSTHGAGVIIAESHQSATSIIEAFTTTGQKVLVQEFIKESGGADIRAIVVGGKVVAAMRRQAAKGEFRSNLHRGASSVAVQLTEEEKEIVNKAARTMGLDVAGVDLLPSNRGYLVMEVNASPGLEGIEGTTGIQVGTEIIDYVAKHASKISAHN